MSLSGDVVVVAVVAAIAGLTWRAHRGGHGWRWLGLRAALVAYAGVIAALAFFPFPLPPWDPADAIVQPWILPIPFATISASLGLGWEWPAKRFLVGNVLAFIPLGIFVPLLWPSAHDWRRAIAVGVAISLAIETLQVALSLIVGYPYRQFDVDDLILNTFGVTLGYGVFVLTHSTIRR